MTEAEKAVIEHVLSISNPIKHFDDPYPDVGMGNEHDYCTFCGQKSRGFGLPWDQHTDDCVWVAIRKERGLPAE